MDIEISTRPPTPPPNIFYVWDGATTQLLANRSGICPKYYWRLCERGKHCKFLHEPTYETLKNEVKFCFGFQNQSGCIANPRCQDVHISVMEWYNFRVSRQLPPEVEKLRTNHWINELWAYNDNFNQEEQGLHLSASMSLVSIMVQQPMIATVLSRIDALLSEAQNWPCLNQLLSPEVQDLLLALWAVQPIRRIAMAPILTPLPCKVCTAPGVQRAPTLEEAGLPPEDPITTMEE